MLEQSLHKEAASCREMAREFAGRPEEPFLLSLASAMEELALVRTARRKRPRFGVSPD
jgi:hypothetical protein